MWAIILTVIAVAPNGRLIYVTSLFAGQNMLPHRSAQRGTRSKGDIVNAKSTSIHGMLYAYGMPRSEYESLEGPKDNCSAGVILMFA